MMFTVTDQPTLIEHFVRRDDQRKSVPHPTNWECEALEHYMNQMQSFPDQALTLTNLKQIVDGFSQLCSHFREKQRTTMGLQDYELKENKAMVHSKKLHLKAGCVAVVVREKMRRSPEMNVNAVINFLVQKCKMSHCEIEEADKHFISFTWAILTMKDMGLTTIATQELYERVGELLEGSGKYHLRGGGSRPSKALLRRQQVIRYLFSETKTDAKSLLWDNNIDNNSNNKKRLAEDRDESTCEQPVKLMKTISFALPQKVSDLLEAELLQEFDAIYVPFLEFSGHCFAPVLDERVLELDDLRLFDIDAEELLQSSM